jgi:hypothetical protein
MNTGTNMLGITAPIHRTMKDLAKEALDIQSACNLSGIVHSFSRALVDLREIARAEKWECTVNRHHVAVLFADKIAALTSPGSSLNGTEFTYAYNWACDQLKSSGTGF